jgi:hypothetical protein
MARMHEYLAGLRGDDGVMTIPEDFDSGWEDAYNGDIADAGVNAAAQVTLLQQELDKVQAELTEAQAANWRLSQVAPTNANGPIDSDADNAGHPLDEEQPNPDPDSEKPDDEHDFFKSAN